MNLYSCLRTELFYIFEFYNSIEWPFSFSACIADHLERVRAEKIRRMSLRILHCSEVQTLRLMHVTTRTIDNIRKSLRNVQVKKLVVVADTCDLTTL